MEWHAQAVRISVYPPPHQHWQEVPELEVIIGQFTYHYEFYYFRDLQDWIVTVNYTRNELVTALSRTQADTTLPALGTFGIDLVLM